MTRFIHKCLLALLHVGWGVSILHAQTPQSEVLSGVDSVDAQLYLTWDSQISQPDEATTRSRLETVFELELRKLGIVVSADANNSLGLYLTVLYVDNGPVAYSYDTQFREPGMTTREISSLIFNAVITSDSTLGKRTTNPDSASAAQAVAARSWRKFTTAFWASSSTWVTTWQGPSGVGSVGVRKLRESLEENAVVAAQAFANAYMASRRR